MAGTVQTIIAAAEAEWRHWGSSTWNLATGQRSIAHTDDETTFAQYVIDHYCSVGGGKPSTIAIADDQFPWSAVGMSAIMKKAGYDRSEFPFATAHARFLRHFIAKRRANEPAAYWGFRHGEAGGEPDVGDLVAYARGVGMTKSRAAKLFDAKSSYQSHSDVVVARRAREIDVIGANVLDSVTKKTLRLDGAGHIDDPHHHWFCVLRRQ